MTTTKVEVKSFYFSNMSHIMNPQSVHDSGGVCRTCLGNKTIKIKTHTNGQTVEKTVICPVCRGSGKTGYITK